MAIKMMVSRTDSIDTEVFVYEKDDAIIATHEKNQIPKDIDNVETVVFTFRKPNYSDSNAIMSTMSFIAGQTANLAALMDFRLEVLRRLCDDWTLCDDSGKSIPCNFKNISNLVPSIAAAACDAALEKIQIS